MVSCRSKTLSSSAVQSTVYLKSPFPLRKAGLKSFPDCQLHTQQSLPAGSYYLFQSTSACNFEMQHVPFFPMLSLFKNGIDSFSLGISRYTFVLSLQVCLNAQASAKALPSIYLQLCLGCVRLTLAGQQLISARARDCTFSEILIYLIILFLLLEYFFLQYFFPVVRCQNLGSIPTSSERSSIFSPFFFLFLL